MCVGTPIGSNRVLVSALNATVARPACRVRSPAYSARSSCQRRISRTTTTGCGSPTSAAVRDVGDPAGPASRWHRTGDVGHLDARGRLWIEGRMPHVIVTATAPSRPSDPSKRPSASTGCAERPSWEWARRDSGRPSCRRDIPPTTCAGLADPASRALYARAPLPLVAVLTIPRLPTDIRHNSKIDRTQLSDWAERILAGERAVLR